MPSDPPIVVIIGGPNGAGKTTISEQVLAGTLQLHEFVNADAIARGLSAFNAEAAAIAAGRVMLARLRELARKRTSFAFESTLASRTLAPWLRSLGASGYEVHILYISLSSSELAIRRVRERVRRGGHAIEPGVIRRRFTRSLTNLFGLYLPIATQWRVYDNSGRAPRLIAAAADGDVVIYDKRCFSQMEQRAHAKDRSDDEL